MKAKQQQGNVQRLIVPIYGFAERVSGKFVIIKFPRISDDKIVFIKLACWFGEAEWIFEVFYGNFMLQNPIYSSLTWYRWTKAFVNTFL